MVYDKQYERVFGETQKETVERCTTPSKEIQLELEWV